MKVSNILQMWQILWKRLEKSIFQFYNVYLLLACLARYVVLTKKNKVRGFLEHIIKKRLQCATASRKSELISASQPDSQAFSQHWETME